MRALKSAGASRDRWEGFQIKRDLARCRNRS